MQMMPAVAPRQARQQKTCTPHSPRALIHMSYSDFRVICDHDTANGDVLRYFEWQTNKRIDYLRERFGIPESELPPEDMLWIEATYADVERGINAACSDSTICRRCLAGDRKERMERAKLSPEKMESAPRSLVELGFIRRRIVARPDGDAERPATSIEKDENGPFIVVLDAVGNYLGTDGKQHNAICEGWVIIAHQYLYMIDTVNAALAGYDFRDPPKPAKRWSGGSPDQENSEPTPLTPIRDGIEPAVKDATLQASAKTSTDARGKTRLTSGQEPSDNNYTGSLRKSATLLPDSSTSISSFGNVGNVAHLSEPEQLRADVNAACFCSAPLSVETLAERLSHILDMPEKTAKNAKWYRKVVEEPLEWIIKQFEAEMEKGAAYRYSWEDLAKRALWTKHDKEFWKGKRVLPENLVGRHKVTGQLVGHNWERMPGDWRKAGGWHPPIEIEYFGPDPEPVVVDADPTDYQAGYGAQDAQEPRQDAQEMACPSVVDSSSQAVIDSQDWHPSAEMEERHTDEMEPVPAYALAPMMPTVPLKGMVREELDDLIFEIGGKRRNKLLHMKPDELSDGSFALKIEFAPDQWLSLRKLENWLNLAPVSERLIERARAYAEMCEGVEA